MTRLEAAEMRFLRSVTGYKRLDKIRSEVIRKELEISGIQDVRLKIKHFYLVSLDTCFCSSNHRKLFSVCHEFATFRNPFFCVGRVAQSV